MFLKLLISMAVALPFDPRDVQDYISRTGCPKFRHGWNSGAASRAPALAQRVPQAICSPGLSEIVRGLRKSFAAAESRIPWRSTDQMLRCRTKAIPLPGYPDSRYH